MQSIRKLGMRQLFGESIRIRTIHTIQDIGLHWHSYFELIYYFSGDAISRINGTELHLRSGSLYLLTPLDMHHTQQKTSSDDAQFLNISFTEDVLDGELRAKLQHAMFMHDVQANNAVYPLIALLQSTKAPKEKQHLLNTLLYRITTAGQALTPSAEAQLPPSVQKSIRYIAENFKDPITLADLAAAVHLSPAYLSDIFSKTCNCTFKAYLTDFRLGYAKQLLQNTDATVTQIAAQSGFQTLPHFLRTFKEKMGITPLQFRKKSP